ncbi:MAG: ABC transporter permease [Armatimonadota bacterium]|nr:MAG: ABC transporter permease [Armatimonadota bacterium]
MRDTFASAWLSITRHRLRSLLAMAGVAVGVCALTSIMSVEKSWRKAVADFFAPMDLQTVRVAVPGHPAFDDWRQRGFSKPALEPEDVEAILDHCPAVDSATFVVTWAQMGAETEDSFLRLTVRMVDADFVKSLPDDVREGRLFTGEETAARAAVCVLSGEARLWLFGTEEAAVGRRVRLGGHAFEVVGVIAGDRHPRIHPRAVYVPSTWSRVLRPEHGWREPKTEIFARTRSPRSAASQIEELMRLRVGGDVPRGFTESLWQVREAALNARTRATLYSGLAGLCALLAAGIGIAALLFVSVSERSREIGVHRALGASQRHVYGEYLAASIILSSGGALLGALGGIPAAAAGAFTTRWQPVLDPLTKQTLMQGAADVPNISDITLAVSWEAVAIAVVLALVTGATAALAPASEAAAVDPALAIGLRAGTRRGTRKILTCLQVAFGVLVLVVLTSYFRVLQSEETAEARHLLGQDRVSATADPVAALREPVDRAYEDGCREALCRALSSPANLAHLGESTPLLSAVAPHLSLVLSVSGGGQVIDQARVVFTSAEWFEYSPQLVGDDLRRAVRAFRAGEAAAIIGLDTKEHLFGDDDPVGTTVDIAGRPFTVVAVEPPPGSFEWGSALVPVAFHTQLKHRAVARDLVSRYEAPRVYARPLDSRQYLPALTQLRDALLPLLPEEYRKGIKFSEEIPETTKQFIFQHKAVAVRGAVGALAVLLVALIGLANMLLVSVHEQVTEIGVRRAFGAQRADVVLHFLSEGVLLSALGAAAGLAVAGLICWATRNWGGLPISVSAFWAAAGAVATVLAGAAVSLIPAFIGAHVHPVEALRYE